VQYNRPFSGIAGSTDSAIDLIRESKGAVSLNFELSPWEAEEMVSLSPMMDLGVTGLVLTATGVSPNSPAEVTINGQGRTVRLSDSSANGSLITVDAGVTLTLRNITLAGKTGNNTALVVVKNGGTLVLEDGAAITGNININTDDYINGYYGGGVRVSDGSRLWMSGSATISGNIADGKGGGVQVFQGVPLG
jgi:hypothetical protein